MKPINRKYLTAMILFAICLLSITGCSTSPTYYSERAIKNYVKNVYGKEYKLTKADKENHTYTFQNKKGFSFEVSSYTQNVGFDASETIFYEKGLRSDYTERVLEYHAEEIQGLISNYDLKVEDNDGSYNIYMKDTEDIRAVSEFISELDHLVAFCFNNDKIPETMSAYKEDSMYIYVYVEDVEVSTMILSSDKSGRLEAEQIYESIEGSYVDRVKEGELNGVISKELWEKYPASLIEKIYYKNQLLDDNLLKLYTLYYEEELDTYTTYLGTYELLEKFENTYSGRGKFAILVDLLGGTYSSDEASKASWNIDGVTWQAVVYDKESDTNEESDAYIEIRREGKKLKLMNSDRKYKEIMEYGDFTIEDLEQMLDINIQVDQSKMTAYIIKN